jgi:alpha-ribazole phosphatase
MAKFYIIRHAETIANTDGKIIGHEDSPLSLKGKIELKKLSKRFVNISFDKIYSSNLGRAKQTSEILVNFIGYSKNVVYTAQLREINYGKLSGLNKDAVSKMYPLYHKDIDFKNPSGESFRDLYIRIIKFIKKLEDKDGTYLIVTHAGGVRAIYSYFTGKNFKSNLNMHLGHNTVLECFSNGRKHSAKIISNV